MTDMELSSAKPYAFRYRLESTALVIIDMQRDFLDPNGFGAIQCGDDEIFRQVREVVPKVKRVLEAARELGLHVLHTREGHKPDLSDLPPAKRLRQTSAPSGHHTIGIGDDGPMGRLLVRGEYGHDIIDELKPVLGEVVIDKPGKGSFWDTTLHRALLARGVTHLLIAGVTTECCVNSTAREAADRGFECCVLTDCTSGFNSSFKTSALDMLCSYDGLFGYVSTSDDIIKQASAQMATPPTTPPLTGSLSIPILQKQYRSGQTKPTDVAKDVMNRIRDYQTKDPAVWTHMESSDDVLAAAKAIEGRFQGQPFPALYGIPFTVKDNIDVAGIKTTASCDAYAYTPRRSARVVDALLQAGALFVGKTNLDQLATGLSGCRSPYGIPKSVYGKDRISGGSSSGSSVAVGAGLVSFALATDTAGSGRVPAAFNGIIGFKPTKGTLSTSGLVPACASLDTMTVLAPSVEEARAVWLVADQGPDLSNPYAKLQSALPVWHVDFRGSKSGGFSFGVPPAAVIKACTDDYQRLYSEAVTRLTKSGGIAQEIDWTPFDGGNQLLYEGSLVNERVACIGLDFIKANLSTFMPPTRAVFGGALEKDFKAWEVFRDQALQARYTKEAARIFEKIDVLLVPSVPCHPTIAEMEADPVALNAKLGDFTHFANVLDLCGINVNAGFYETETNEKLPFGVTLIGASGTDGKVFDIAREFERTA